MKRGWRYGVGCIIGVLVTGCDYNRFATPQPTPDHAPIPNMQIAVVRERCVVGPTSPTQSGAILSGYVTTSDKSNNFYQSFMIEDNSGALEVRAGMYDLHNRYPIGQRITLRIDGLTAALRDGVLQIGLKGATANNPVEPIETTLILDRHLLRSEERITPTPLNTTIQGLTDLRIGGLVCLSNLHLDPPSDTTWAISRSVSMDGIPRNVALKFRSNTRQDSIFVYTSGYASFADEAVPKGTVSLTGILLRSKINGREVYQLKLRDLRDVKNEQRQ